VVKNYYPKLKTKEVVNVLDFSDESLESEMDHSSSVTFVPLALAFFSIRHHVYYESIKREPKIRGIYECRCDERLRPS
jgi:hypothetical protein